MTLVLGFLLGCGMLLVASPFLWPASATSSGSPPRLVMAARDRLAQAGLYSVGIPTVIVVSVIVGVACAALAFAVVPVLAIGLAAGLTGLLLPAIVIVHRARSRRKANRTVWPDLVDHLVSAVRSGLALPDSVVTLARTGPPPVRDQLVAFERDYRATGNFGLSIDALKERLADPVADRVLETLRMSREVGGSELTTVLRNLAAYLRHDAAIRAEVEARQSWVMNAARLGVAAPWIILVLLATRPEAVAAYNAPAGVALIFGGLVLSVVAYRIMVGIARIPEERRWFQ